VTSRRRPRIDGEGVAWAVGAFVASLLIGLLIEPFRGTIGLENIVICYLLVVVVAAAIGGRAAGIVAAVSAALAYDFFLTTPYHTLVIDSLAQVITVALLVATGIAVSIGGRVRRRSAAAAEATPTPSGCCTGSPRPPRPAAPSTGSPPGASNSC
jgi:K+-sensing histidine kinase KdpD